jgi:hypothetical protein
MLSDADQLQIVERVTFEIALRKQLAERDAEGRESSKRDRWWETKLALVAWGALITAGLVPWLQYYQSSITWKRQNRFDTTNYRLQSMRECLKELSLAATFAEEGYERGRHLLGAKGIDGKQQADFDKQFSELQNRRFQQNARVSASMLYFKDPQAVRALYQQYVILSSTFLLQLEAAIHSRAAGGNPDTKALDNALMEVDICDRALEAKIKEEIGEAEDDNEKYRL